MTDEAWLLETLADNDGVIDAYDLLQAADPTIERRFNKIDKALVKLLSDVRKHFPDATFYTANGGFHLLLGNSHAKDGDTAQRQLEALSGTARIGDGDW